MFFTGISYLDTTGTVLSLLPLAACNNAAAAACSAGLR